MAPVDTREGTQGGLWARICEWAGSLPTFPQFIPTEGYKRENWKNSELYGTLKDKGQFLRRERRESRAEVTSMSGKESQQRVNKRNKYTDKRAGPV